MLTAQSSNAILLGSKRPHSPSQSDVKMTLLGQRRANGATGLNGEPRPKRKVTKTKKKAYDPMADKENIPPYVLNVIAPMSRLSTRGFRYA